MILIKWMYKSSEYAKKKFNIKEMIISYKNMLNEWKLHYIYIITLQCNFKSYITSKLT